MSAITSRSEFKEYCLRKLGKPVIQINIADEQVDDRVDDAFEHYRDYHYDAVEKVYLKHQVTQDNITNGYIELNDAIVGVKRVLPLFDKTDGYSKSFFDVRYQMHLNEIYDLKSMELLTYELTQSHLQLVNDMMAILS